MPGAQIFGGGVEIKGTKFSKKKWDLGSFSSYFEIFVGILGVNHVKKDVENNWFLYKNQKKHRSHSHFGIFWHQVILSFDWLIMFEHYFTNSRYGLRRTNMSNSLTSGDRWIIIIDQEQNKISKLYKFVAQNLVIF